MKKICVVLLLMMICMSLFGCGKVSYETEQLDELTYSYPSSAVRTEYDLNDVQYSFNDEDDENNYIISVYYDDYDAKYSLIYDSAADYIDSQIDHYENWTDLYSNVKRSEDAVIDGNSARVYDYDTIYGPTGRDILMSRGTKVLIVSAVGMDVPGCDNVLSDIINSMEFE